MLSTNACVTSRFRRLPWSRKIGGCGSGRLWSTETRCEAVDSFLESALQLVTEVELLLDCLLRGALHGARKQRGGGSNVEASGYGHYAVNVAA
jgi:hypothetical protein